MANGFIFNGTHTDAFGLIIRTKANPLLAKKRIVNETVMGKDGTYIFEDGYENKELEFECILPGGDLLDRRLIAREAAEWLNAKGELILDYESDKKYTVVQTVNDVDINIGVGMDKFNVRFVCKPQQYGTVKKEISFENPTGQITVENEGNYKSFPMITATGSGNISISTNGKTISYSALTGTVIFDCENKIAYAQETAKVNKMMNMTGEFIELKKGTNQIVITGTMTSLDIDFYDTYI